MRIPELAPLAIVALIVTVSVAEDPMLAMDETAAAVPEPVTVEIHGERIPCLGERDSEIT